MDIQSRSIKLTAVLALVIILGVVYLFMFKNQQNENVVSSIHSGMAHDTVTQSVSKDTQVLSKTSGISIKQEHWSPMGDAANRAEVINWFSNRGVYGFDGYKKPTEYDSYDEKTLRILGENGDLKALHKLTDDLQVPDYKELLEKAAIHGSTGAFRHMAISKVTAAVLNGKSDEELKLAVKDALAYAEAAQLRGDWWVKIGYGESLLELHPVNLTEQDKNDIQKRGQEIYADLQSKRIAAGLGNYDNSIPDSVMKFYEEMLRPLH